MDSLRVIHLEQSEFTMARKHLLAAAAALAALTTANAASAAIYTYKMANGNVLTIDTVAGTGSLIGTQAHMTFTGDFSAFTGGASPSGSWNISINAGSYENTGHQTGTNVYYGSGGPYYIQSPAAGGHTEMLTLSGSSESVWADWVGNGVTLSDEPTTVTGCGSAPAGGTEGSNCSYNPGGTTTGGTTTGGTTTGGTTTGGTTTGGTTTGGTTTGGTTTGGTTTGGTTTGGTAVPEPTSEFALFGLGLAAILIGRRDIMRRKAKA